MLIWHRQWSHAIEWGLNLLNMEHMEDVGKTDKKPPEGGLWILGGPGRNRPKIGDATLSIYRCYVISTFLHAPWI